MLIDSQRRFDVLHPLGMSRQSRMATEMLAKYRATLARRSACPSRPSAKGERNGSVRDKCWLGFLVLAGGPPIDGQQTRDNAGGEGFFRRGFFAPRGTTDFSARVSLPSPSVASMVRMFGHRHFIAGAVAQDFPGAENVEQPELRSRLREKEHNIAMYRKRNLWVFFSFEPSSIRHPRGCG